MVIGKSTLFFTFLLALRILLLLIFTSAASAGRSDTTLLGSNPNAGTVGTGWGWSRNRHRSTTTRRPSIVGPSTQSRDISVADCSSVTNCTRSHLLRSSGSIINSTNSSLHPGNNTAYSSSASSGHRQLQQRHRTWQWWFNRSNQRKKDSDRAYPTDSFASHQLLVQRSHIMLWYGPEAAKVKSLDLQQADKLRVCFRNGTNRDLILCWIDFKGRPHHFYNLPPWRSRATQDDADSNAIDRSKDNNRNSNKNNNQADGDIWTAPVTDQDHNEGSYVGHAFVIAVSNHAGKLRKQKSLRGATLIAAYRPESMELVSTVTHIKSEPSVNNDVQEDSKEQFVAIKNGDTDLAVGDKLEDDDADDEEMDQSLRNKYHENKVKEKMVGHIVVITEGDGLSSSRQTAFESKPRTPVTWSFCSGQSDDESTLSDPCARNCWKSSVGFFRRQRRDRSKQDVLLLVDHSAHGMSASQRRHPWNIHVLPFKVDASPKTFLDTTRIKYRQVMIAGWPCRVNAHTWDKNNNQQFQEAFTADMQVLCERLLPKHALDQLRASHTLVWINQTFRYGPKACPITGIGMCYHPGLDWLEEHKMHPEKLHCIEMYDTADYLRTRSHWGQGGVLLHEFSHAYHNKCVPSGYDNPEIEACYEAAMEERLYECVAVHGPSAPKARAYACSNACEYFAELSTAFLGGTDQSEVEEYNKWYPFNRKQVKEHDPRAFDLLQRIWKVELGNDDI